MDGIGVFRDVEIFLDDAPRIGKEGPVGADASAIFIGLADIVGANGDKPAIRTRVPARIKQCRQLAVDMGLNPNVWFQNVEYAVAKKVGAETVNYVANIYKYYVGWKLMSAREAERTRLKQAQNPPKQPLAKESK